MPVLGRDVHRALVLHGLAGVDDQIVQHLSQLTLVRLDRPEVIRDLDLAGSGASAQGQPRKFADERVGFEQLAHRSATARKRQELAGQVASL